MKFKYQAKTKEGATQVGFVEAANRDAASAILASHELFVLSVVADQPPTALDNIAGFFGRVGRKDLIVFTRQLATLLEARLPLNNALKILFEQTTNKNLKEAISQVTSDIDAGISFSAGNGTAGKDISRLLY
jgi:type IV pilus assembly protein PilC